MLVCGDVVYAQTWQVLTLENCIEPLSYASTAYFVARPQFPFDCFVKIGQLARIFWANGFPIFLVDKVKKKKAEKLSFVGS